jgi:hypothetical protein
MSWRGRLRTTLTTDQLAALVVSELLADYTPEEVEAWAARYPCPCCLERRVEAA